MATLQYAFCDLGSTQNGCGIPVIDGANMVSAAITLSGSNQQSAAATKPFVRLITDSACYIAAGSSPDATVTTSRIYLAAGVPEYLYVGKGNKIAAVSI